MRCAAARLGAAAGLLLRCLVALPPLPTGRRQQDDPAAVNPLYCQGAAGIVPPGQQEKLKTDDDDGAGYSDADEYSCGTDSKSATSTPSDFDGDGICDALDDEDNRADEDKLDAQEAPGFTPGFASVLAVVSLLGAAMLGRRKDD